MGRIRKLVVKLEIECLTWNAFKKATNSILWEFQNFLLTASENNSVTLIQDKYSFDKKKFNFQANDTDWNIDIELNFEKNELTFSMEQSRYQKRLLQAGFEWLNQHSMFILKKVESN